MGDVWECANGRELTMPSAGKTSSLSYLPHLGRVVCLLFFPTLLYFEENCDSKLITGFPKYISESER